jgi:DNA polymerase IV
MDAFFASIEQRDFPEFRNKPLAVGGSEARGVVAAASYEARQFGVRSAMPSVTAKRLCPALIFTKPRFDVYKAVSWQIRQIFQKYTSLIEPLSLDEAYLDVTQNHFNEAIATVLAEKIRKDIFEETGLTASAGISFNKFLAKTASDINKPNGQFVIKPQQAEAFIEKFPVKKFYGIGKVTAEKMHSLGIFFGKDLKEMSLESLNRLFGKNGSFFYNICRGIDQRAVEVERETKSVSVENTLEKDIEQFSEMKAIFYAMVPDLYKRFMKVGLPPRTLILKIKFSDFSSISRSRTIEEAYTSESKIYESIDYMIENNNLNIKPIRLLGIGCSNFRGEEEQHLPKQLRFDF